MKNKNCARFWWGESPASFACLFMEKEINIAALRSFGRAMKELETIIRTATSDDVIMVCHGARGPEDENGSREVNLTLAVHCDRLGIKHIIYQLAKNTGLNLIEMQHAIDRGDFDDVERNSSVEQL